MKRYPQVDILFFERPLVDLKKFAFKIADEIKKIDRNVKLGAVCLEFPGKEDQNQIDWFINRHDIKHIDHFLECTGVKLIVFTQSRIPDLEFLLHAKFLGIKTIMIQEGVMFDGMNINDVNKENIVAVLRFLPKVIEYLNIVRRMCWYDRKSFILTVWSVIKRKKNITVILANSFSRHLIGDFVLTMGEYWSDYYIEIHGYSPSQIRLIGDHDLDGFVPKNMNESAICYICNALAEDGAIKKKDFYDFIGLLSKSVDRNTKLYIKLHPRSEQSYYDLLNNHNVEFVREGDLPSVNVYIGHRSALLGRALYESDSLIIWRFPNEKFSFYEKFASATCTNAEDFISAVKNIDVYAHKNQKLREIEKVYWNNPYGSMKAAAVYINDYLKKA